MKLNELIASYNADKARLTAIVDDAEKNADGKLTDEQQKEFDTLKAGIPEKHDRIERIRAANSFGDVNAEQSDRVNRVARNETKEERKAPAIHTGKYKYAKNQLKVLDPECAYEQAQMFLAMAGSGRTRERAIAYCESHNLNATITSGMGTSDVGDAIPELFSTRAWEYFATHGLVGRFADNYVLTSKKLNVPKITGEVTVYIPGEATAITNSAITIGGFDLEPIKMTTQVYIPSEAVEDEQIGLVDKALASSARQFAQKEDSLAFTNTGAGNKGITNLLATSHSASKMTVSGDTWTAIDQADLSEMVSRVPSQYRVEGELAWYCHDVGLHLIFDRIGRAAAGNSKVEYAQGAEPTFMGFPIRTTPVMYGTVLTDTGADVGECHVLFGNLKASTAYGVRREFTAEPFREYVQDLNGILCTRRVAYVNHELGTDSVAGPMIGLYGA